MRSNDSIDMWQMATIHVTHLDMSMMDLRSVVNHLQKPIFLVIYLRNLFITVIDLEQQMSHQL